MQARHPCTNFTCLNQSGHSSKLFDQSNWRYEICGVKHLDQTSKLNPCPKCWTPKFSTNHSSAPQALTNQIEDMLSFTGEPYLTNQIENIEYLVLKFMFSKKAPKNDKIFTVDLTFPT